MTSGYSSFPSYLLFLCTALSGQCLVGGQPQKPRNIVMIAVDDLNDWVGPLRGHPQVQTPALDRLAARGMTFTNAHCQAPLCNPSRTSLLTGLRPSTTGIYGLSPSFRELPAYHDIVTLPQFIRSAGYRTLTGGKIYHGAGGRDKQEFDFAGPSGGVGARPKAKLIGTTPGGNNPLMDWGTFPHDDTEKGDWQVASWTCDKISASEDNQPFFLACGFFLPHVPCYVTQPWLERYPLAQLKLPPYRKDDRADTPESSWYLHWSLPEPRTSWLIENNQWKPLVQAYLASITFVDSQVQRVLDAIDRSPHRDNTLVILWSDHGYHLGEKGVSGKNTLWERATRVPLIIAGPGIDAGTVCTQPVELLDLYPTLAELVGQACPSHVEGLSLLPQLSEATTHRQRPAITTHNQGNHSVRDHRYRYIRYQDGAEEFYDLQTDPNEFENRIHDRNSERVIDSLRRWLPNLDAPLAPGSAQRILENRDGVMYWEGKPIDPKEKLN